MIHYLVAKKEQEDMKFQGVEKFEKKSSHL